MHPMRRVCRVCQSALAGCAGAGAVGDMQPDGATGAWMTTSGGKQVQVPVCRDHRRQLTQGHGHQRSIHIR